MVSIQPPCQTPRVELFQIPALQSHLVQFATSLLALLNPLADFAIFLSLTTGRSRREQQGIAIQAAIAIATIMVSTLWLGNPLLTSFGISIGAFSVAGGVILFGIGLSMLHSTSGESDKEQTHQRNIELAQQKQSPAIVPLGIPISAGPGVITALLVSSHANVHGVVGLFADSMVCLALAALMGLVFWFAPTLGRLLGETAMHISTQVMGLIVAAIASQMVLNGLRTALPVLAMRS